MTPAYIIPISGVPAQDQDVMTNEDVWAAAAMEIVWRVLMPVALNSYVMHRFVKKIPHRVKEGFELKVKEH